MSLMDDFVRTELLLRDHASLAMWATEFENREQNFLRECARLQNLMAGIISEDVVRPGGMFYSSP
jgi:hypothetical protein